MDSILEKNLNAFYKIVRLFRNYKRMTPFEIEINRLDGKH